MSRTPIYKNRTYEEIVTVEKKEENQQVKFEVKFDETKLTVGQTLENNEKFTKFKTLVGQAVDNLQKNLDEYAKNEFLRDLYTYPEKFQHLKQDLKTQLTELEDSIDEGKSVSSENLGQYKELAKKLDQLRTFNKEAKKVAAADFGIMTAKTINNAIASWIELYICAQKGSSDGKKLSKRQIKRILTDKKDKNTLKYWENKLEDLAGFKANIDEPQIKKITAIVDQEKEKITHAAANIKGENMKKGVKDFVNAIKSSRKTLGVDKKDCSAYARLGMLKLCCDVVDNFNDGPTLTELKKLGSAGQRIGEGIIKGSDAAAEGAVAIMGVAVIIGVVGTATVVLALPGLLIGGLIALLGFGTGMVSNVTRKAGQLTKSSGTSAGKSLFGTRKTRREKSRSSKSKE